MIRIEAGQMIREFKWHSTAATLTDDRGRSASAKYAKAIGIDLGFFAGSLE